MCKKSAVDLEIVSAEMVTLLCEVYPVAEVDLKERILEAVSEWCRLNNWKLIRRGNHLESVEFMGEQHAI